MREQPVSETFRQRPVTVGPGLAGQVAVTAVAGVLAIYACRAAGLAGGTEIWIAVSGLYLLVATAVGLLMRVHYPHRQIGGCNVVTLLRAALVCALLAPLAGGGAAGWAVAAVGCLGLALDGVDGWLARRSGLTSRFGARFDMEVDSALALVLALHVLMGTAVGAEVLVLGLMRYGFVILGRAFGWMRAPLPQRFRRKLICVVQLVTLLALQLPVIPLDLAIWMARGAAAALVWSFAADIVWLWRHRR